MEKMIKAGRVGYAVSVAAMGVQQFIYSDFRPIILPVWPVIPGRAVFAWISGAVLIAACAGIVFRKNARNVSFVLGGALLLLFLCGHIPFELLIDPYVKHLGVWTNALKELALSGGAFVVASGFSENRAILQKRTAITVLSERLMYLGRIFFSITMISFGIDHFLYTSNVVTLVPAWIPYPFFWTYFAAVALIGSGIAIILKIKLKLVSILLGLMIFLWLLVLHIPRAVNMPYMDKGNEITSAFSALAFSCIAFMLAGLQQRKESKAAR